MTAPYPPSDDRSDVELVKDAIDAMSEARQHLELAQSAVTSQMVWLKIRMDRRAGDRDEGDET